MSPIFKDVSTEKVFRFFEEISNIPHPSYYMDEISEYCVNFAKRRGLFYIQDENKNVIIIKEAGINKQDSPGVILQGHLDMVAEKKSNSKHDFKKDPLRLKVCEDYIYAEDTTLGADDGVAIAIALALLDEDSPDFPRIEVVFTVDEEVGLLGAASIDLHMLRGKYLINIDSEEEGVLTAGCAGGLRADSVFSFYRENKKGMKVSIDVKGLMGGHSGIEIHKERGNSNIILGQILSRLNDEMNFSLIEINGGNKDNAIPRESTVSLIIDPNEKDTFGELIKNIFNSIKKEFIHSEPDLSVYFSYESEESYQVIDNYSKENILNFLAVVPNGVQNYSQSISGLVETSTNLGIMKTKDDLFTCTFALRSSVKERKISLSKKIKRITKICEGNYREGAFYPEWEYQPNSELLRIMSETFYGFYNKHPQITTVHAGLECGYLLEKLPGIQAVSLGPDMYGIHTTEEKLSISSLRRVYDYLVNVMKAF